MSKCIICGKTIERQIYNKPICSEECFVVDFWNEVLDDDAIIVDGACYHDGGRKDSNTTWLGFGGREWKIQMNDGRIIETNNLWHNGKVPLERKVKDNAKFI